MLKLGVIDVLNVLPVYYQLLSNQDEQPFEPVFDTVTELNRKLNQGQIDLSAVSSFEYALRPELYYVLPDLSVGSDGPVYSIYLFADCPLSELRDCTILLTTHSLTSVHLIQYLLEGQNVVFSTDPKQPHVATLLIADQAIRRFYQKKDRYVFDLGAWWKEKTGLPFVFALWVVRKVVADQQPGLVRKVAQSLLASRDAAFGLLSDMAQERYSVAFPNPEACEAYFANLHYQLGPSYLAGFQRFQEEMVKIGKLNKVCIPEFLPD